MRLGRLAVAGLTAGVVAGFVIALLLPRRRRTVLDLTVHDDRPASFPAAEATPAIVVEAP